MTTPDNPPAASPVEIMHVETARSRVAELEALAHRGPAQRAELTRLRAQVTEVDAANAARAAQLAAGVGNHVLDVPRDATGQPYDPAAPHRAETPSYSRGPDEMGVPAAVVYSARSVVARLHDRGRVGDRAAEVLDGLLRVPDADARWRHAQMVATLGSEEYERGFLSVLADPHALRTLPPAERDALARGRALAMEVGTGSAGGYAAPLQLDPAVILTSDGAISPVRQLARTVTGTAKEYDLVSSAGVTVEWAGESVEVGDHSPVLDQPKITPIRQQSFVPFSMELEGDWAALSSELGRLLTDASSAEDASVFITGAGGTAVPLGLVPGLTGTASEVTTAGAGAMTLDDIETLQAAVPARFRANAVFVAALQTIQAARRLEVVTGQSAVSSAGGTLTLLDDPLYEASDMDQIATGKHVLLAGDLAAGYVIYDRMPTVIELVPHLFGPNHRPTGQRGLYMIRRLGTTVIPQALRMLTIG